MYQPRRSILQMFDPLMANPPSTPQREESNASPDNSDKENDAPHDPLSLTQYFNRTYHVKSLQKPVTPNGKLIDFGDASIDEGDGPVLPGPSVEAQLDDRDVPPSTSFLIDPHEESDTENAPSFPPNGPFVTPQNRRILGDIDVDALQPPKPPMKQASLKISFLTAVDSGPSPSEASTTKEASSDPKCDDAALGPVITLYPPTFDSIPPTSSAPQISDRVDSYLSPQPPFPRTTATFTPRRSPLSSENVSHRLSMDLQSSFQLQLQNADYSFDLVNDKVSFLENGQELSFPESDDDSDSDEIVEDVGLDDMLQSLTLQDKAVVAAKQIFSPTSEKFAITSIPERDAESSSKPETPRATSPISISSSQDFAEAKTTAAVPNVAKKSAGSVRRPSLASGSSISGFQSATTVSKPPMRILAPPSKRLSTTTTAQRTSVARPPTRQSSTTSGLSKLAVATTKTVGNSTNGPRRVLVQANDKPTPRAGSTSTLPGPKTHGPQRVLVRTASETANSAKKPLGPSSSINPPVPASRLPGPSRIAIPSTLKQTTRTSSTSKSAGRWV